MGVFKNRTDLQTLQTAGRIAGEVCDALIEAAQPGVSTVELETLANRLLAQRRSSAPFKPFYNFNHAICVSINAEIVNGPPSRERVLTEGDLVKIAIGSCYKGLHGKAARTTYCGEPSPDIERLISGTGQAIFAAVEASRTTTSLKAMLKAIAQTAQQYRLTLIDESGGCGIGRQLHEPPLTPNDPDRLEADVDVVPGMAFTLMPMMTLSPHGGWTLHEDGWTQVTHDGDLAAHVADTCLMTDAGLVLLTRHG